MILPYVPHRMHFVTGRRRFVPIFWNCGPESLPLLQEFTVPDIVPYDDPTHPVDFLQKNACLRTGFFMSPKQKPSPCAHLARIFYI